MGGKGDPCADDDRTTQAAAITYTSAPFRKATTIAGPIEATLYLSSTRPDAELVATVEVVAPNGSSRPLGTGALLGSLRALNQRLSWRQNGRLILPWHPYTAASARALSSGTVEHLEVEVFPAVARIAPGEHMRLTVTSGDTALQPSGVQLARLAGGVYSIQRGGNHASSVTVPMAAAGALRTSRIDWGGCNGSC
jgi:predicted acyl esterase